ncbi:hypothetical protein A4H97_17860 [Niastella yeongjuensis]|uniref:BACON domain-containing protein n=1 Tax=Niastella yeongjuensis TaxID=354355 RepID=A0A1V9E2F9_9BACT|nr:BACON domain-containing protein [Niastella yeongjuensis]OQP40105.1 hypothetical protein A4H97_17860 [Niastella yeongjuensis]SEO16181.1 Putative binding domain-containing protein, N-terminal [Niastella yeongjuensis]
MTRIIIIAFAFLITLVASCSKKDDTFKTYLALDSRFIILNGPADTTKMIIYSDKSWTVESIDDTPWLTVQTGSGSGVAYAVVAVTDNSANLPRIGRLLVKAGDKTDTIRLGQRGIVPKISITATAVSGGATGGAIQTPISTNLPLELMTVNYNYDANGTDWISGLQIDNSNLSFNVAGNSTAAARSATILLSYLDAVGTTTKDSIKVNQPKQ